MNNTVPLASVENYLVVLRWKEYDPQNLNFPNLQPVQRPQSPILTTRSISTIQPFFISLTTTFQAIHRSPILHEFCSISDHFSVIWILFSFAVSRFLLVLSSLSARRHLVTSRFAPLHMPVAFQRKPRAWHSSRIAINSSQPVWWGVY